MCNIVSVTNMNDKLLLNCTPYDGNFDNAKKLTIISKDNEEFNTNDFILEKTRPCFSETESPWIMVGRTIPDKFLISGNQIVLQ